MKDRKNYKYTLRLYHLMYMFALAVIALVALFSQVLIQNYLSNQQSDTHLINYAAKLRSDSQAMVKYALLLQQDKDYKSNRKDFINTFRRWKKTHESLRSGNIFLNIPKNENKELEELFTIVDKPFYEIVEASEAFCEELRMYTDIRETGINDYLNKLLKNERTYLLGMEMIVFDYDRILRNNISFLKKLEWILFTVLICCLVLEALFIFIPLYRKLKASFVELVETEKYSRNLIDEIRETNRRAAQSHKELREVNFALEKATYFVKTDAQGNIIYANDKYCTVTRYTMAELRGKPLFYNNMGGEKSIIYSHIENEEIKNEVWQGEIFDHASDGTGFWMNVTLMPVFNNKGELYRYFAICFDITRSKQAEKEIRDLLEEKMKRKEEEQKIRSESILAGEERERKRLSAEIHDGIGQMLTALKMKIEMLDPGGIDTRLSPIKEIIISIVNETRKICTRLRPAVLDDFGLKAAIADLAGSLQNATTLTVELDDSMETDLLTKQQEMAVYRILQEASTNVLKHSSASYLSIVLDSDAESINILITDNGKGFNPEENNFYCKDTNRYSYGLITMKERAEMLGARLDIYSQPGKGTKIHLQIPLLQI